MTLIDFVEWSWTITTGVTSGLLVYLVRESALDVVAARLVKPEENGRRGIYAASRLRVRLLLLFITGLLTYSGLVAIATPNPDDLTATRAVQSLVAIAIAGIVLLFVVLDAVDRHRIATYKSRASDS